MSDNIYVEGEVEIKDPKLIAWLQEAAEHNTKELEVNYCIDFLKQYKPEILVLQNE